MGISILTTVSRRLYALPLDYRVGRLVLRCVHWSRQVLVLYLERPEHNVAYLHAIYWGRFGYNDLKEAAPVWSYAL